MEGKLGQEYRLPSIAPVVMYRSGICVGGVVLLGTGVAVGAVLGVMLGAVLGVMLGALVVELCVERERLVAPTGLAFLEAAVLIVCGPLWRRYAPPALPTMINNAEPAASALNPSALLHILPPP